MVGSYGPKDVLQTFEAPAVMAPKGMLARGSYIRKSQFLDDDKNIYLQWEWRMDIKRDWD